MKNIVIIEDNFDHFQIIRKLIASTDIDVFPKEIHSGKDLCDFLTPVKGMIDTSDATTREKRKKEFFNSEQLKQDNGNKSVSLYIVDYQLLADNNTINGFKFCEYIDAIREGNVPAIILTVLDPNDIDVNQQKISFTNQFLNSKIEFDRKVQNQRYKKIKSWDENNKTIDEIVANSSELSTRLKDTINRLCKTKTEQTNAPYDID